MRFVFVLVVFSVSAFADDVMTRAKAAEAAAKKRGAIPVPDGATGEQCFVPKFLEGEKCAEGFKLCLEGFGQASCTGYASSTLKLRPDFEGEPQPQLTNASGEVVGMPYSHEAGPSVEVEVDQQCSLTGGFGVLRSAGETDEQLAARTAREQKQFEADEKVRFAKCEADLKKRLEKESTWQKCELLSVDACRGEAFLRCKGNVSERGLVRATWSRTGGKPASDSLKIRVLSK